MAGVVTIPNLVSVARLSLVPVFVWLLLGRDDPVAAGWLFGLIGATDWVDGFLARRLNQVSEVGKFLDPLADRIAVFVALVGGLIAGVLAPWFAWAILLREALVGVGALWVAARGRTKLAVRRLGKLATLLVYAGVGFLFLASSGWDWVEALGWALGVPGLVLYWVVGVAYLEDAGRAVATATARV